MTTFIRSKSSVTANRPGCANVIRQEALRAKMHRRNAEDVRRSEIAPADEKRAA